MPSRKKQTVYCEKCDADIPAAELTMVEEPVPVLSASTRCRPFHKGHPAKSHNGKHPIDMSHKRNRYKEVVSEGEVLTISETYDPKLQVKNVRVDHDSDPDGARNPYYVEITLMNGLTISLFIQSVQTFNEESLDIVTDINELYGEGGSYRFSGIYDEQEEYEEAIEAKCVAIATAFLYALEDEGFDDIYDYGALLDELAYQIESEIEDPVITAAKASNLTQLAKLSESGADLNVLTPLLFDQYASDFDNPALALATLELGIDTQWKDKSGKNMLLLALEKLQFCEDPKIITLLLERGVDPNERDSEDVSPLSVAVEEKRSAEIIDLLIKHGADVNAKDIEGSPLLFSVINHNTTDDTYSAKVGKLFVEHGAHVNARDAAHSFLLFDAISLGEIETVKMLLNAGSRMTSKDDSGLFHALFADYGGTNFLQFHGHRGVSREQNKEKILSLLLDRGADVNVKGKGGITPLMKAVDEDKKGAVRMLLKRGADPTIKDKKGTTATDRAIAHKNKTMEDLLSRVTKGTRSITAGTAVPRVPRKGRKGYGVNG